MLPIQTIEWIPLGLMPHINLLEEDGTAYLEIIVEPSTVPISLRGSYYWRSGSVKQQLKGHALTDFLLEKEVVTAGRLPDISGLSTNELPKKLHLLTGI